MLEFGLSLDAICEMNSEIAGGRQSLRPPTWREQPERMTWCGSEAKSPGRKHMKMMENRDLDSEMTLDKLSANLELQNDISITLITGWAAVISGHVVLHLTSWNRSFWSFDQSFWQKRDQRDSTRFTWLDLGASGHFGLSSWLTDRASVSTPHSTNPTFFWLTRWRADTLRGRLHVSWTGMQTRLDTAWGLRYILHIHICINHLPSGSRKLHSVTQRLRCSRIRTSAQDFHELEEAIRQIQTYIHWDQPSQAHSINLGASTISYPQHLIETNCRRLHWLLSTANTRTQTHHQSYSIYSNQSALEVIPHPGSIWYIKNRK